ncbi:MAG: EVE domain-containing protein [Bacteriovoracaceae bacterium]|nr:EVE domain-containing protein [Bacteriovoracaceae bacterium]
MRKMGFNVGSGKLEDVYPEILEIQKKIIEEMPEFDNLYKLDALSHYIIGVEEGINLSNEIFNSKRIPNVWIEKTILKNKPERQDGDKQFSTTLFSPQAGKDGRDTYSLMRDIQIGDIVLHFVDNQDFIGVSKVIGDLDDDYAETNPDSEYYGKDCYSIELGNYQELEARINRADLFERTEFKKSLIELLDSSHKIFYNKKLELNQGAYLTEAPEKLIQMLNTIHKEKAGAEIPGLERWGCFTDESYWIFQGSPQIYDVPRALNENAIREWWVKSHKDKIAIGDKGIIWVTGSNTGCYAFFEVISELYEKGEDDDQKQYYLQEMKWEVGTKVGIKIEKNISNTPILKESIKDLDWFQEFKGGNQGTTFKMTKQEYEGFKGMTEASNKPKHWMIACGQGGEFWNEFQSLSKISIGWAKFGDHRKFKSRDEIEPEYLNVYSPEKRPTNNTLCIWEFSNEIRKGDIVFVKKGRTQFLAAARITSDSVGYDSKKTDHQMYHNVEWLKIQDHELDDGGVALKSLTNIDRYPDFVKKLRTVYGLENETALNISKGDNVMKNQIFYGPPGTGKTMTILNLRDKYTSKGQADSKDDFIVKMVKSLSWWECIACALADLGGWTKVVDIKEHPIIKAKIEMQNNKSVNNTLWGQLQNHTAPGNKYVNTREDKRMEPFIFEKDENSKWKLVDEWKEMVPDVLEIVEKISNGQSGREDEERYKFVTFHPNFTYEDFILGIRPDTDDAEGIRYEKVPGKFKEICDMARKHKDKEFAIFIDEINRGNIPAIFGELITLIEEDKRNIPVDIPNSDEKFSVPDNLWIYGTMNTADRSVESLDIALRRRFSFIPKYPEPEVLKGKMIANINLQTLLETMNDRIDFLKDRDHTIGHSYFLKVNDFDGLKRCFTNRIIPLLEEYFYNDFEKIGLVLGSSFVKKNDKHKNTKKFFADFDSDFKDDLDEYEVYYIENIENIKESDFVNIYEKK